MEDERLIGILCSKCNCVFELSDVTSEYYKFSKAFTCKKCKKMDKDYEEHEQKQIQKMKG